jgi:hypothetical protein
LVSTSLNRLVARRNQIVRTEFAQERDALDPARPPRAALPHAISSTAWASVVGTDKYCRGRAARHRGGICARFDRLGEDLAVLDRAINEATVDRP